ncbi:DamX protein [Pseudomonas cuatrocienegasensis]|uniref:DamX protein n=1 Tax=Pseudomonas cuatrocienegasensis TaxID=543360 RepID=A0ABY1B605_9PSED|nr:MULTISPECIES: AAA family ATPase [Pseudomonas]OEC36667.1 cell division protein [Pseudomonas sp. 21C1]SEQ02666.1 DamX protein [Pseudomonas cuatrocienegasensis]
MTSLHADEAFLDHYQFTHDPFAARVPGFKFFPAQRKPVLGQLHHLARYSQLLLVVTGPLGSGKTLLRQALVASTNKQAVQSVVVSAQGATDPASLLRQIAQALQVQQADPRAILAQVGQLALTGQEVYLLVDDAEQLSEAALVALLALAAGNGEGRPHVFLFAEPEVIERLEVLAAGEERFHAIELQPYSEDETREYLAQRLDGAAQGIELISDEQIAEIHEQSGGWPGSINEVARETLITAMLASRGKAKPGGAGFRLPRKHALALVVVAIGVLAAWLMQGRELTTEPASTVQQVPAAEPQGGPSTPAQESASTGVPAIEFAGNNQPLPLPLVGDAQPVIRQPLAEAAGMSAGDDAEVDGGEPVINLPPPVPVAPVTPSAPVAQAPVPATAPAPAPAPAPKAVPVTTPKPAPAPAPVAASAAAGWYGAQADGRFTLQILGARAERSAQAFVSEHGSEYRYFRKQHQGQPLYVVTYGSFASRDAAQAALRGLPAKVQAGKPWPRTFGSIKQEIAQSR